MLPNTVKFSQSALMDYRPLYLAKDFAVSNNVLYVCML